MKGIGGKILAVMAEVGKVGKDKTNAFHKYDYASDEAVVGEIRGALIKNRLVVIPNQTDCTTTTGTNQRGETTFMTSLAVEYTLLDVDSGEAMKSTAYGQGVDSGDKGVYKAATGAEKYFLLKTFLIATGDDAEKESPQRSVQATAPVKPAPAKPSGPLERITTRFELSEPIKSKTGKIFRKAIDAEGSSFFVWADEVCADLQIAGGAEVTVEYEAGAYPTLKRVLKPDEVATPF